MAGPDSQYENQQFLVLNRFRDLPDALVFESVLDSAAIECFLVDENTIRMDWFWSDLLGGIKLYVRRADRETASRLLDQGIRETFEVEGVGEYQQPRCPNCHSLEVSFQALNRPVDYTRALFGGPLPLDRSLWECHCCGHQWPESNEKPPANFLISASSILLMLIALGTFSGVLLSAIAAVRRAASR